MIRATSFIALAAMLTLAACQPQKTPEQVAQEQQAAALQQMAGALGALAGTDGAGQVDPNKLAATIAQAGAIAGAMDPNMTAEDRAKLQAITGSMSGAPVHPTASAWLAGANKAMALLGTVHDEAGAASVKPQLAAIYAEMAVPAAQLKAMSEQDRDVAFGSALPQLMSMGLNAASLMMPLQSNPTLARTVEDMLNAMPEPN